MLSNDAGIEFQTEQSIFPIITFIPKSQSFKCLGTGFFITPSGGFITARHVIYDNNNKPYSRFYAVQRLSNQQPVIRDVLEMSIHPTADIAIGMLGEGRDGKALPRSFELAPPFKLSFKPLEKGDSIMTFGYPKTNKVEVLNETTFTFMGHWSTGSVVDLLVDGSPLVRNKCYQTNMHFDSGTSGGPVFHNNYVVGINSSSMSLPDEEEPLSYVTPIDFILDLNVGSEDLSISVKKLVKENYIHGVF